MQNKTLDWKICLRFETDGDFSFRNVIEPKYFDETRIYIVDADSQGTKQIISQLNAIRDDISDENIKYISRMMSLLMTMLIQHQNIHDYFVDTLYYIDYGNYSMEVAILPSYMINFYDYSWSHDVGGLCLYGCTDPIDLIEQIYQVLERLDTVDYLPPKDINDLYSKQNNI